MESFNKPSCNETKGILDKNWILLKTQNVFIKSAFLMRSCRNRMNLFLRYDKIEMRMKTLTTF